MGESDTFPPDMDKFHSNITNQHCNAGVILKYLRNDYNDIAGSLVIWIKTPRAVIIHSKSDAEINKE